MGPRLILASASPRRRELLSALGIQFEAIAPEVEELGQGEPTEVVLENARRKAQAGLEAARRAGGGEAIVLGVDTDVALDGRLLGKAADEAGARERLAALSGRTHEVLSGVALAGARERTALARSLVTVRDLSEREIRRYVASGEWRDRAGAYAIQGLGSTLVDRLEGDFANVVGLPIGLVLELLGDLQPSRP